MAQLTPKRRSELMQSLLAQMHGASQFRGNRTFGEAALRMGTQFLNKRRYDKLAEQEKADEAKLAAALTSNFKGTPGGGAVTETQGEAIAGDTGDPFTITKKERGLEIGKTINENALAEVLALPPGLREQGLAALQAVNAMQPKPKEPKYGLKEIKNGDVIETWVTKDGLPEWLYANAPRSVIQKIEQGEPGAFDAATKKFRREFRDEVAAVNAWAKNAESHLEMMRKTPGGNTVIAAATNLGNRIMGEVRALAGEGYIEFDDTFRGMEVGKWEEEFSAAGLAGANPRVKSGFLALAIQKAAAMGMGTGKALSDKDVDLQLRNLGANQNDPDIVANIFSDSYRMMRNRSESRAEQHPEIRSDDYSFYEPNFGQTGTRIRTWVPGQGFVEDQ